jgi:hypothetical protein
VQRHKPVAPRILYEKRALDRRSGATQQGVNGLPLSNRPRQVCAQLKGQKLSSARAVQINGIAELRSSFELIGGYDGTDYRATVALELSDFLDHAV